MKQKYFTKCRTILTSTICTYIYLMATVHAAPGNLAQQPLFLGSTVQPNIFFGLDDSGSMDWETTLNAGTYRPGERNDQYLDFTPDAVDERRELCVGFNVLAYNPNTVYTPWKGEDENGLTYSNKTLTTALDWPYDNDDIDDVSAHFYFVWNDMDADGEYDGPAGVGGDDDDPWDATDECNVPNNAAGIAVNTLPATLNPGDAGYPNSQQNYANWYTYYRKREYVAKRAISELVWNSNDRMGLATLHNNHNGGSPITDMSNNTNRLNLLDDLGQVFSTGGTPLRRLLENIGEYYDNAGSNSDHSPLGFTNASPILSAANGGECQQNFTVLFSDGFWNGGDPSVGDTDSDGAGPWDGGSHDDGPTNRSNTLADVAMHFYETDLNTSLANNLEPITGVDENTAQHMTTFTVAFGVTGSDPNLPGIGTNVNYDRATPFTWPNPLDTEDNHRIDDMVHAAWNGRGKFLGAQNPADLTGSLQDVLAAIADRVGTASSVTFNSNELEAGTQLFLTQFSTEDWSGDMLAFDLDSNGDIQVPEAWSVASVLDARTDASVIANRVIYTFDGTDGKTLLWGNLTTAQQNDFRTNPDGTLEASPFTTAQKRLDHFRGDRSEEEGQTGATLNLRARGSRMGDVVHSGPLFVGKPEEPFLDIDPFGVDGKRYSDFKLAQASRKEIVYVGANDGMVHAFDTTASGAEVMAYVPSSLFSSGNATQGLHYLSDPAYVHSYYVDATFNVGDAFILTSSGGGVGSRDWTTVLTGGLRGGGKGVFALDVTDPTFSNSNTDAASHVLWEFLESDAIHGTSGLSQVGFVFGKPKITLTKSGKWAVIFGNGYNSDHGEASLIVLFIEEGVDGTWDASANDFIIIPTGVGDSTDQNGLGEATLVDLNGDQVLDYVYASDIKGNVWAFDMRDTSASNWDVAHQSGGTPVPLFSATDVVPPASPSVVQPITVKAAVTRTETSTPDNFPNVLVILGTGQYLTAADPANSDTQSLYGVWDAGQGNLDKSDLVMQTITNDTTDPNKRTSSDNDVDYADTGLSTGVYGWYVNLPDTRERLTIDPIIIGDQVLFGTIVPDSNACASGGSGWIIVLDSDNGGEPSGGGIDVNNDGVFDSSDQIANKFVSGVRIGDGLIVGNSLLGSTVYVSHTGGSGANSINSDTQIGPQPTADVGRLSWKELVQ